MKTIEIKSFGVIPVFKDTNGDFLFCLVLASAGHWGFPKGFQNTGESEQQAALRELKEEAGIEAVDLFDNKTFKEEYSFERDNIRYNKSVKYFLGFVTFIDNRVPDDFKEEISELKWVNYKEAKQLFTFKERKEILDQAYKYLK